MRLGNIGTVFYVLATGYAVAQPAMAEPSLESMLNKGAPADAAMAGAPSGLPSDSLSKQALAAYQAGQYKQAFDIWQPLSTSGDAEAARAIGFLYENGLGVNKSLNEALKNYEQAAQAGSVPAQYRAGQMYLTGEAGRQDFARAFTFLQSAAQAGHAAAQYNLGIMYEQGVGTKADATRAAEWVGKASAQGHDKASVKIAQLTPPTASPFESPADKKGDSLTAPAPTAVAGLKPEHVDAQKRFAEREKTEPMNQIKWDAKAQRNENPHFFATDEEIKGTPLPPDKMAATQRPTNKMDYDSTNNPFDPARLPDPKRPASGASLSGGDEMPLPNPMPAPAPMPLNKKMLAGTMPPPELIPTPAPAMPAPKPVVTKPSNLHVPDLPMANMPTDMDAPLSAAIPTQGMPPQGMSPQAVTQATPQTAAPTSGAPTSGATVADLMARANTSPKAAFMLGRLYYRGDGVPKDLEKAKLWWQKAAAKGHTPALTALENLEARMSNGALR